MRRSRPQPAPAPIAPPRQDEAGVEAAWRIHSAVCDWTAKVDSKASFALTIASAVLAAILALSAEGRQLATLNTTAELWWYRAGIALVAAAAVAAMLVVAPRLRTRGLEAEAKTNYIYFGHLRFWTPTDLSAALSSQPLLPVLSRQVVEMSKIAWIKHRRVQASILLAAAGTACVTIAGLLNA